MARSKPKIGFVGVGGMGQAAHLRHYATLPECEVVALAELRPKLGEAVARRWKKSNWTALSPRNPSTSKAKLFRLCIGLDCRSFPKSHWHRPWQSASRCWTRSAKAAPVFYNESY
jgi:hypothetical protein